MENLQGAGTITSALHYRIRSWQILVTGEQQKPLGGNTRTRSGSGRQKDRCARTAARATATTAASTGAGRAGARTAARATACTGAGRASARTAARATASTGARSTSARSAERSRCEHGVLSTASSAAGTKRARSCRESRCAKTQRPIAPPDEILRLLIAWPPLPPWPVGREGTTRPQRAE
jgi:hypothetical protein